MMRKITQGFTIIELLIAFAIGSLLSGILFQTFFQSNRFVQTIDATIATNTSAMVVLNQLEKDIAGIYAPIVFPEEKTEKVKKTDTQKETKEPDAKNKKQTETKEKKPKKKPLTKIFYATEQNDTLGMLSFITTNSLSSYVNKEAAGRIRPKLVRVLYKLEQEPDTHADKSVATYRLMRKESAELDFERSQKDTTTPFYELATNIQEFSAEYITLQEDKEGNISEESATSWDIKEKDNAKENKDDKKPDKKKVPDFITLTLSFANKHDTTVFESTFAITSQPYTIAQKQTPQKAAQAGPDAKKATGKIDTKEPAQKASKTPAPTAKTKTETKEEGATPNKITANKVATIKQSEKQ